MSEVATSTAKIWLQDGVVHLKPLDRREQTLEDAIENVAAVAKLTGGVRMPMLIHFQEAAPQTPECRAHYTSESAFAALSALAIVTNSMLGRVIGNLMMGMNKSPTPMRLFATEKEALTWLQEFVAKGTRDSAAR